MTFAELTAIAIDMRGGNEDDETIAAMTDEDLILVKQDPAKRQMQLDLEAALTIVPEDSDTLDTIVNAHIMRMQVALGYKQLELYYEEKQEGEGSKSYAKWKRNIAKYDSCKVGFSQMRLPVVAKTQFLDIAR